MVSPAPNSPALSRAALLLALCSVPPCLRPSLRSGCSQCPRSTPLPPQSYLSLPPPDINQLKHHFLGDVCPDDTPSRFGWSPPGGSDGKESTCNVGDLDSIPGLGRSPGEGHDHPLRYSCLENAMDSPWRKESDMTE